jgi:alpha-tubulin suppressor-like RCC1 family protein
LTNQTLKCWGANTAGALGDGSTTDSSTPVSVSYGGYTVTQIVAGYQTTCLKFADNYRSCWGKNDLGELGDGTLDDRLSPQYITSSVIYDLYLKYQHAFAYVSGAFLQGWGVNSSGKLALGNNSNLNGGLATSSYDSPVTMAVGSTHSCMVNYQGKLKCWGSNNYGELGYDNTTTYGAASGETESNRSENLLPTPMP